MLNKGQKLSNYDIVSELGKGGMGTVYLAKDSFLDRYVAIKELNPLLTADAGLVERFRNEARLQAKLIHANIAVLYGFFEQNGHYYMVMEYAEGRTLKEIIRQTGPIPEKRAINILKQVVSALQYAHGMGIVHRDIKPSNIVLDDNDKVKILDFGIARIMGEKGLTQTGQQLGTVAYMSPEQVRAVKDIDGKTDVYSLGVTFFEMLSGRMPYDMNTESDFDVMSKIVHEQLPDPREYYPHVSDNTIELLARMTQKDRDKRADIAELESYLNGNNNVEAPEKRKEEKDTLWLGVGRDGVVLSDVAKDEAPVQKEKKGNKKLLWLLLLLPIILGIVIFSRIQKNNSMIFVEGGRFMMGSNGEHDWENPVHEVTLSSFWISKYEVTQKEWQEVMGSNPSHFKGNNLPVEYVSWYDVIEYCNKRSIKEGLTPCYSGSGDNISCNWNANGYRLPTEAEWEYAARGGNKSKSYEYAGSYALGDVAWYDSNSGSEPHPVGQKRPNELGLYDMSGNVWEWCWDWHNESSYGNRSMRDPRGATNAWGKVQRGGSWNGNFIHCRVADRSVIGDASGKFKDRGFRVARANK